MVRSPSDIGALDVHDVLSVEVPLDRVRKGEVVRVARVDGGDAIARRLVDLGFRPGTEVRVERVAPLGDPVQYRLHGYRLALRKREARRVITRREAAAP